MPQFIFATRDTPKKVQTDGNPGLKPMALAMPCGWPGCVDCWAADPRAAAPTRRACCFVPMRVQCCNLYCMPVRRRTGESRDRTAARRHPAAPGGGRDSSARARERRGPTGTRATVTRTRQTPPHGRGPAPVAEPRGRVRVDHCICEPSVLALYPAAEPSAEPRSASAHGPRRRTHPRYDTRHKHLTRDLNVST